MMIFFSKRSIVFGMLFNLLFSVSYTQEAKSKKIKHSHPVDNNILGTYRKVVGNREYTFNRTPRLELQFNDDGTITDITPGLNRNNVISTLDGKNVFYMIGYLIFSENYGKKYKAFENIYLPDGIYTIRQFVCDPNVAPDLNAFTAKIDGWGKNINGRNSTLSEVFLSIKTIGAKQSKSAQDITPDWLKVSRQMRYQDYSVLKDWSKYNKFVGTVYQNMGTTAEDYQKLGLHTEYVPDFTGPQENTWYTPSWHSSVFIPDEELYNHGKSWMQWVNYSPRFVLTDQIHEKVFGADPDIYGRSVQFYKGAYDELVAHNPSITNKRQTGLFGSYNYDDFTGAVTPEMLLEPRERYVESLTSHAHRVWDVFGHKWKPDTAEYYTRGLIDYRNINHMMYLYNNLHYLPYRLLYVNERVKIGTKTYKGIDKESNWLVFTWPATQNMVMDEGEYPGIEYYSTGEIIPFQNGEILSQQNFEIPAPWDEWINMGFWSTLVSNGFMLWNSPKSKFGTDTTKLNWWTDQPVYWTPEGGTRENYFSGKNGAPLTDANGMRNRLWASPQDAALAGSDAVWSIRDRITTLSHTGYSSSEGEFIARPGKAGLHLNGFGPLNIGQYVVKDAFDQKKGVAILGTGKGGNVIIYYNGFLAQHEYEDNVTVIVPGRKAINLGRVYGRQTVIKTF